MFDISAFEKVGELTLSGVEAFESRYAELADGVPYEFQFIHNNISYACAVRLNIVSQRLCISISNDEDEEVQTNTTCAPYPQNLLVSSVFGSRAEMYFEGDAFYFREG